MDNKQVKELIDSFKGYRDLLVPIQKNLADFVASYDSVAENVEKLTASFSGDVKGKVEDLFKTMNSSAQKATDIAGQIDKLSNSAKQYATEVTQFVGRFKVIEERLGKVNELEKRAEEQIARLDDILEVKTKNYNLRELQANLETYNKDIKKVAGFLNEDVGDSLKESHEAILSMREGIDGIVAAREEEGATIAKLLESSIATESLLREVVERGDTGRAYLYELLDSWAIERGVKKGKK